jgi:predicted permease
LPWSGYDENFGFEPEGRPEDRFGARYHFATPGYFRALGVPIVFGRTFESSDDADAPRRVVVNAQLAREVWGDEDPVGNRIAYPSEPSEDDWWTVVGVVGDVKDQPGDELAKAAIYMPFAQEQWTRELLVVVRTHDDPETVAHSLRAELATLDKDLPLAELSALEDVSVRAFAEPRFLSWLTSAFAAAALALAVIGLYGVISYTVSRETRAIAIRMAVGARANDVIREVLSRSLRLVAIGIVVGVVGALITARSLESLLYGVTPHDPLTLFGVTLALGGTALVASLGPARRASQVDPMRTLRSE